jgi:DNA-directed RNA polymerase subunit N (RpoN/RPB10)
VITCKEAVDRLWEYLDRNLPGLEHGELDEHLGICRHCCGELEFARKVREMLRRPVEPELSPEARMRLEALLRDPEEQQ